MTTKDIDKANIVLMFNYGRAFLGATDNHMLLAMIVEWVQFIELDTQNMIELNIKDIIKKHEND